MTWDRGNEARCAALGAGVDKAAMVKSHWSIAPTRMQGDAFSRDCLMRLYSAISDGGIESTQWWNAISSCTAGSVSNLPSY